MPTKRRGLLDIATALSFLLFVVTAVFAIVTQWAGRGRFVPTDNPAFIGTFNKDEIEYGYYYLQTVIDPDPVRAADAAAPAELCESLPVLDGSPLSCVPRSGAYPAIRFLHRPRAAYKPTGSHVHTYVVGLQFTLPYWFVLLLSSLLPGSVIRRWLF
jgi:hypothetical protein